MAASAPKNANAIKIPERIGKYPIINEVGRGSTGTVFMSHDPYYGRDVAIKVYNIEAGGDDERARVARKMFLSEAHMVGMLHHPNILPIYDAGEENGHCYIVTEHVHGARTLSAYCRPDNLLRLDDVVETDVQVRQGAALRAFARRDSPRHQALEHHAHDRQRRAHHRFRHRAGRRFGDLAHRRHRRFAQLHVTGAGAEPGADATVRTCIRSVR